MVWERRRARAREPFVDKIDQDLRTSSGRETLFDGGKNLQWAAEHLQRGKSLKFLGQKQDGGCSVKVVVEVQVGWEQVGANFALVLVVVVGDMGSLERDVSAANGRARVEDRDCCLRFPR